MVNLVLDLDETLIHTVRVGSEFNQKLASLVDFHFFVEGNYFYVLKRPGLDLFLDFVFKYFRVGIWTAAEKGYAKEVCKNILSYEQLTKVSFIYSRSFCQLDQSVMPPVFVKPLAKIFQAYRDHNQHNTFMIDNTAHVMKYNTQNGVVIPDFRGNMADGALYLIRNQIIRYYQNKSMNSPIWGLVNHLNASLRA